MQTSTLSTTLIAVLLLASASAGGALAATVSLHGQQSPTGTPGTGTNDTTTGGASTQGDALSVTFNDQQSSGQTVLIQSVTVPQPGFVVIYDSTRSANETNQIIGSFHLLGTGTFRNITVPLDTPINQSKSLTAVVHADTNDNGQFDYVSSNGTQDAPVTPQGERRVVDIAQITIQSGSNGNGNDSDNGSANMTENEMTASEAGTATTSGSSDNGANGTNGAGAGGSNDGSSALGPGFGLVVGVSALLAGALLVMRRS